MSEQGDDERRKLQDPDCGDDEIDLQTNNDELRMKDINEDSWCGLPISLSIATILGAFIGGGKFCQSFCFFPLFIYFFFYLFFFCV